MRMISKALQTRQPRSLVPFVTLYKARRTETTRGMSALERRRNRCAAGVTMDSLAAWPIVAGRREINRRRASPSPARPSG